MHACRTARLACRSFGSPDSSGAEDAAAAPYPPPADHEQSQSQSQPQHPEPEQQQQHSEQVQASSSHVSSRQEDESAQSVQHQQEQQQYSPEQQLLRTAMKKLQALETYQQLMADSSSGTTDKHLQRKAGDTPSQVSAKIAADTDEIPLLDAAILIAQVRCHGWVTA